MVHLTFVRCADLAEDGCIALRDAKALFLLAKIVTEKFGKPQLLFSSGNDEALASARIFNLVCAARGINEVTALNHQSLGADCHAFMSFLEREARSVNASHIVLICTHNAFVNFFHVNPVFANSCTLCADKWDNILADYHSMWFPFQTNSDANEPPLPVDIVLNYPCSASDTLLIENTIAEYHRNYVI